MVRVLAKGGTVLLADVAIPAAAHADAYDALECLRDPSHVGVVRGGGRGMAALLRICGLARDASRSYSYPFTADAEDIMVASFPDLEASRDAWLEMLRVDGPAGRLGIEVNVSAGKQIRYAVPIAVEVACKSSA